MMTTQNAVALSLLAALVNDALQKIDRGADPFGDGVRAGDALLAAKELAPRGTFTTWIENSCLCGVRMARIYMSHAKGSPAEWTPLWNAAESLKG